MQHPLLDQISTDISGRPWQQTDLSAFSALAKQFPFWNLPHMLEAVKSGDDESHSRASLYSNNIYWTQFVSQFREEEKTRDMAEPAKPAENQEPKLRDILSSTTPVGETALAFEPMHAVDYFASQGIKLDLNRDNGDKFTRQLKSFTEWLKVMKKINPEQAASGNVEEEKKVQGYADSSVKAKEVITEAMAEVWLKQGNNEKAIEMYQKLSLINPSKSAYFAAKIEQIKEN